MFNKKVQRRSQLWDTQLLKINHISYRLENNHRKYLIEQIFKGVFRLRPNISKYSTTWEIDPVLRRLERWSPTEGLSLKEISLKLTMLLALGSAFRV